MNAVPLALKRAIGVGHRPVHPVHRLRQRWLRGLQRPATLVTFHLPTTAADFVFWIGLILTVVLWVLKIRAALVISILVTTIIALVAEVTTIPKDLVLTPSFTTLGQVDPLQVFQKLPVLTAAILIVFAIMLTDFFDTMGTVTGVAAEAGPGERGRLRPGRRPRAARRLGRGRGRRRSPA